jgi:hypothetical protein
MMNNSPYASRLPPRTTAAAPPDLAAHATQMRRWTFLMIGGTVLLAVGFISAQVYLLKSMAKTHEEDKPAWTTQTANMPGSDETDPREPLLAVIREQTKEHLYQTFEQLGLLGDALNDPTKRPIALADAEFHLVDIHKGLDRVEQHLEQVPPAAFLTEEDRKDMELAAAVVKHLRTMADQLEGHCAYLRLTMLAGAAAPMLAPSLSLSQVNAARERSLTYQTAHGDAWEALKKMLHLRD